MGERQNAPKNFLLLEISLRSLSGLGTCRLVCTRLWQVHQSLFAASPFPAWNAAKAQQSPAAISSAGAQAMEPTCSFLGSTFVPALLETHGQGLRLCRISPSQPRDFGLAADTGISIPVENGHRCIHRVLRRKIYKAILSLLLIFKHVQLSEKQQNCS